ncbi:hypothetical protein RDI58_000034 [Solanum bulbocastanum]|uniref:Uncharacterized protein n=1 Tax=Solanum bulbocastanum TaxID=147425 RepID=A0AAN8U2Q4_SOLBU
MTSKLLLYIGSSLHLNGSNSTQMVVQFSATKEQEESLETVLEK